MNCKEFEKLIPVFLQRKMDYPTLKSFHEHMDRCEDCKEELSIQYLVMDGLQHLEEGDSFDLQSELDDRLAESRRRLKRNDQFMKYGLWMELAAVGALAGIIIWLLI